MRVNATGRDASLFAGYSSGGSPGVTITPGRCFEVSTRHFTHLSPEWVKEGVLLLGGRQGGPLPSSVPRADLGPSPRGSVACRLRRVAPDRQVQGEPTNGLTVEWCWHARAIAALVVLIVRVGGDLEPRMKTQLLHDVAHVTLHCVGRDAEPLRYFLVAHTGRDKTDHLALPLRHAN